MRCLLPYSVSRVSDAAVLLSAYHSLLPGRHVRDSCGGAEGDFTASFSESHTFTQSYSLSTSTEFELGPITAGLNEKVENSSSQTESNAFTITTTKGRQATLVASE